jgi:predicted AAA+ superfamily ATPase
MERLRYKKLITEAFINHPVVAILGPRQCGKTTLAKQYASTLKTPTCSFDLEDPTDLAKLINPKLALADLSGLVILDEIQRKPELFPLLRVLADREDNSARFLILGSASRDLIHQSSETLAGRIAHIELTPFSYPEVGGKLQQLWLRGGFPKSYLAPDNASSWRWRKNYVQTFLERDVPSFGINVPPPMLRRFWLMLTHYHGCTFNATEIANSMSISQPTGQHYVDILSGVFMVRQLAPWFVNIKKRQVKAPKIYFRDSGIFHYLLGIEEWSHLQNHPKLGLSWEGFALEEIIRFHQVAPEECFFWATHGGAELDLLLIQNGRRLGFEFKYSDQPRATKSMQIALEDLQLDNLTVIFPGHGDFPVAEKIHAIGLVDYLTQSTKPDV